MDGCTLVVMMMVVVMVGDVERARKSAAGYDLTRLMIGSEGTLGVITEVTVRLRPKPDYSAAVRVCFPTVADAAAACMSTLQAGVEVGRCELMDDLMVDIVNHANDKKDEVATTLLYELVGTKVSVAEQVKKVQEVIKQHKGYHVKVSTDPQGCEEMWRARKEVSVMNGPKGLDSWTYVLCRKT